MAVPLFPLNSNVGAIRELPLRPVAHRRKGKLIENRPVAEAKAPEIWCLLPPEIAQDVRKNAVRPRQNVTILNKNVRRLNQNVRKLNQNVHFLSVNMSLLCLFSITYRPCTEIFYFDRSINCRFSIADWCALDFQFRLSSFQFPVSTFQFPVSSFDFPVSSFQFRLSSFQFRISSFQFRISSFHFPRVGRPAGRGRASFYQGHAGYHATEPPPGALGSSKSLASPPGGAIPGR